ncbi:MAG: endonuclease domain-containing protein [Candidatus Gracilibacteria bacterium]
MTDKRTHQNFTFENYQFNKETGALSLVYSLDEDKFEEKIYFPVENINWNKVNQNALETAFFNLHLIGGIGYWKTTLPKEMTIKSGSLDKDQAAFWDTLYTKGLGEFFFKNQIDFRDLVHFPYIDREAAASKELDLPNGVLLPIGGGKDSLVSAELLFKNNKGFTSFSVHAHGPIKPCVEKIGKPWLLIKREMDPLLFEWNKSGTVWNGHVPITAYISFVMVICCILYGYSDIVFSLEKSADEGMVEYLGMMVNHQYSKSYEFEEMLHAYIKKYISPSIEYYSLLRPWYELKITEQFAASHGYTHSKKTSEPERDYLSIFSSCNRNFTINKQAPSTLWCGKCEKCAFVFLMLAAFLPKAKLLEIFGADLFEDDDQLKTYKELLGLEGHKPFECVGTPKESAVAFYKVREKGEFKGSLMMEMFEKEYMPGFTEYEEWEKEVMATTLTKTMPEEIQKLFI